MTARAPGSRRPSPPQPAPIAPPVDIIGALAQLPLFGTLSRAQLTHMLRRARRHSHPPGHIIMAQGDSGDTLEIILSGEAEVSLTSPRGSKVVLATLGPGEPIGELALLDGGPRSATVTAMRETETLALHRREFFQLLHDEPDIAIGLLQVLAQRLRATDHLVGDSRFLDVSGRLAKKLLELANTRGMRTPDGIEIDLLLTQRTLAALIGARREAVSRTLSALRDSGVITVQRHRITVLQPDALAAAVRPR